MYIIEQLVVAFVSWFWVMATLFLLGFSVAVVADSDIWSPRLFLIGILLSAAVFFYGAYYQIDSYNHVADLRTQFEAVTASTDETGATRININQLDLISERNRRLARLGRCTYGAWWETKSSGEKPVAHTGGANYYWCGRYAY